MSVIGTFLFALGLMLSAFTLALLGITWLVESPVSGRIKAIATLTLGATLLAVGALLQ